MSDRPVPNPLAPVALDAAQDERLRKLYTEIRCLVCQNQSLADSAAELAVDLRHEVQVQIAAGSSDAQIKRWLVERYGDFVLYRPPWQASTALLWVGPFAALGAGGLVWAMVQRRRKRAEDLASTATPRAAPIAAPMAASSAASSAEPRAAPVAAPMAASGPASSASQPTTSTSPALERARQLLSRVE